MTGSRSVRWAHDTAVDWNLRLVNGLPADVAADRFDQIVSDLWEQEHAARRPGPVLAAAIVGRLLRGILADVSWRMRVLADVRSAVLVSGGPPEAVERKRWVPLATGDRPFDQTNGAIDFDTPAQRDDRKVLLGLLEAGAAGSVLAGGFAGLGG